MIQVKREWQRDHFILIFKKYFLEKGEGMEKRKQRNIDVRETLIICFLFTPDREPNPQPKQVPRPGIEPVTLHFAG